VRAALAQDWHLTKGNEGSEAQKNFVIFVSFCFGSYGIADSGRNLLTS